MSQDNETKNRGTHGDSSFMLDGLSSSSENPPVKSAGRVKKREVHNEALVAVRNICYFQSVLKVTDEVMASKMGISRATWANRKAKPLMLTLGEVIRAADYFKGHGIDINSAQLMTVLVGADVGTEVA